MRNYMRNYMRTLLINLPIIAGLIHIYWKADWTTPLMLVSLPISLVTFNSSKDEKYKGYAPGLAFIGAFATLPPLYQTLRYNRPLNIDVAFAFWVMALCAVDWYKRDFKL